MSVSLGHPGAAACLGRLVAHSGGQCLEISGNVYILQIERTATRHVSLPFQELVDV